MVGAICRSRDAERAMEEAKEAARRAELASLGAQKNMLEIGKVVDELMRDYQEEWEV